jgi:hypothetical protein
LKETGDVELFVFKKITLAHARRTGKAIIVFLGLEGCWWRKISDEIIEFASWVRAKQIDSSRASKFGF